MGDGLRARPCPLPALNARRGHWEYLGDAHVDGAQDHDSIKVGRAAGGYHAIQLRISGGAINFERVIVRYGNGEKEEIPIRARIPAGGQTRVIDLPGSGASSRAWTFGIARTGGQTPQGQLVRIELNLVAGTS